MYKPYIDRIAYFISATSIVVIFLAANKKERSESKALFTPYQIIAFEIKATEGFSPKWYEDGFVRGKKSYSIGYGWNDQGSRRNEIKGLLEGNRISKKNATILMNRELEKYGRLHEDPYKDAALKLYSYNRGLTTNPRKLGKCCNGRSGCGSRNRNIRTTHNKRRKFELALWNHDWKTINEHTELNRQIVAKTY